MAGEAGEACNVVKKMRRLESADRKKDTPKERKRLNRELAKELADVVIYVDLLAARCDIDLGTAVIEKFNEVSKRRKTKIRIKG